MTPAIDIHAHIGQATGRGHDLRDRFMTGDPATVLARAEQAGIVLTCFSPLKALFPRIDNDAVAANEETRRDFADRAGFRYWVVIDPRKDATFRQAADCLGEDGCIGIKIHPEEHGYPISDEGDAIFKLAAAHQALVLTHSGEANSLPADFVPFADRYPEMSLILAHLGLGPGQDPTHQVRAIQAGQHDNLYTDTSSAGSILPGLIEWAVAEIGAERILFGTDTPLYFTAMQRARIDHAAISEEEKRALLIHNAQRLFKQHGKPPVS